MQHHINSETGEERLERVTIGPATPVQIVMVVGFLTICGGGFGSSIWWASSISTKMDVLISKQTATEIIVASVISDVKDLKNWQVKIEATGSPAMVKQMDEVKKEVDNIKREFDIHEALDNKRMQNYKQP